MRGTFVCTHECTSWTFVLGRALIKAKSERNELSEKDAPVFQLFDKHSVNIVSRNITVTVAVRQRQGNKGCRQKKNPSSFN